MSKNYLIFVLVANFSFAFSQSISLPIDYVRNSLVGNNNVPSDVIGSPYFNDAWQVGTVNIGDNELTKELRYNAYQDIIEFKENGSTAALLKRNNISVKILNTKYIIQSFQESNGNVQEAYFNPLNSGEILILRRFKKELKPAEVGLSSYQQDKPAQFIDKEYYYLKNKESDPVEVKPKKKDILENLPKNKVIMAENFIKKNNLKLKSLEEIIDLLNHLNTIKQ